MPRIQISEPGKTPQPYKIPLDREEIKVGRSSTCDIQLSDPSTSSLHCVIRRVEGGYILEDNGSTNGVKMEDARFKKLDLNQDSEFELGDVEVSFSFTDEEYDELSEEDDFTSEQKLMLPPTSEEKARKKAERAKKAPADPRVKKEDSKEIDKKHSSSRASRMLEKDDVKIDKKSIQDNNESEEVTKNEKKENSSNTPSRAERIAIKNQTNPVITLLFIIFCIVAFLGGLSIKHYLETGRFLITDFLSEEKVERKAEE